MTPEWNSNTIIYAIFNFESKFIRVLGYQLFLAAREMPEDCRSLRTRLSMEHIRLMNWVAAAGLIEHDEGLDLPEALKADKLVLVAILTEIRMLMDEFAELNGEYQELQPDDLATDKAAVDADLLEEFASVSISYEKKQKARKYFIGTNHLIAAGRDIKTLATNPKQLKWAAKMDKKMFRSLLDRLRELNNFLNELLRGRQAEVLEDVTRKSHLEMVQVRNSVEELKFLVVAALLEGQKHGPSSLVGVRPGENLFLASLAEFKRINIAKSTPPSEQPPDYQSIMASTEQDASKVTYESGYHDLEKSGSLHRPYGQFNPLGTEYQSIWIEWKMYQQEQSPKLEYVPRQKSVVRVQELVALLQRPKPEQFCTPHCLGYFDDYKKGGQTRFGIMFALSPSAKIKSLATLLTEPSPSLSTRIALARKIVECVLYFHAVDWLHKSIRSDNVIFFAVNGKIDLSKLLVSGFSYSRPDTVQAKTGANHTEGEHAQRWDLYRHPAYQGFTAKGNYRKTFDIYSLGVILLEIGYWQPIDKILGMADPEEEEFATLAAVRMRLLDEPGILAHVTTTAGDRYRHAVETCIRDRDAFGIAEMDDELSAQIGTKLQQGFLKDVVSVLEGISI